MGFKIEKQTESGCVIRAVVDGDDGPEFLLCVQRALKNLWSEITVDMSQKPYALATVMPLILKLQQVLSRHDKIVVMKGIHGRVSPDLLSQLSEIGVEILKDGVPVPVLRPPSPGMPRGTIMPDGSKVEFETPEVLPPLPPAPEVEKRFKDLRERLAQAYRRKKYLENEQRIYTERLHSVSKGKDNWSVDQNQVQAISELERQLNQLNSEKNALQKNLEDATQETFREKEESKRLISEYQTDHKKKKETLDKTMADLTKQPGKLKQEFKKKSEVRKEKLARLMAKS